MSISKLTEHPLCIVATESHLSFLYSSSLKTRSNPLWSWHQFWCVSFFSHHHHAILWPAGCPTIPLNSDTLPTDSVWSQRLRAQFHETALTFRYQLQDQLQARVSKGDDAWLFLKIDRNPNITVPNRKGRLVGHLCFWPIDYRSINYRSKDPFLGFH